MVEKYYPRYIELFRSGELERRAEKAYSSLKSCNLCPRGCGVNRLKGERGFCRASDKLKVASFNLHWGEEPPLVGESGSGTIFFSHCTLRCVYCQNYPISQLGNGREVSIERLARMILSLQKRGSLNINFVTPTHFIPQILSALLIAIPEGLAIPLVYNTSGYESVDTLKLLEGVIDIYLPDARYTDEDIALKYSHAPNYPEINKSALKEMYRQVGDLKVDRRGIGKRGLIVRHLVLPEGLAGTEKIIPFLVGEISRKIHISLMNQYFPANHASEYPPLDRMITQEEYESAISILDKEEVKNGWIQEHLDKWESYEEEMIY